jgi:hypothetical protein
MSNPPKTRRPAGKNSGTVRDAASQSPATAIEPHAELRDQQGRLLAGIVRRDGEWVLGMDGRIAGSTASAAHVFAMVRRAGSLHESQGTPVRLTWSDELKAAAEAEAAAMGLSFEQFEAQLGQAMEGAGRGAAAADRQSGGA